MTRRLTLVAALSAVVLIGADRSALVAQSAAAPARTSATTPPISEFDVRGMTVLVKQRPGSETVAAGLFIRGGAQNITAANAGIESLMLTSRRRPAWPFRAIASGASWPAPARRSDPA
jgi:hypothetical protein